MAAQLASLLLVFLLLIGAPPFSIAGDAHPGYSSGEGTCTVDAGAAATGESGGGEGGRRIIDITHAYVADLPAFAPEAVTGPVVRLKESMADGSEYNLSELKIECHMGTHVDAPGHINQANFAAGLDVDTLDLDVLNGKYIHHRLKLYHQRLIRGDFGIEMRLGRTWWGWRRGKFGMDAPDSFGHRLSVSTQKKDLSKFQLPL